MTAAAGACIDLTGEDEAFPSANTLQATLQQTGPKLSVRPSYSAGRPSTTVSLAVQSQGNLRMQQQLVLHHTIADSMALTDRPSQLDHPGAVCTQPPAVSPEGQEFLLDQAILLDILRVLSNSWHLEGPRAPTSYDSLHVHYLQHIPRSQAEHQGRMLVYLEWLTRRLSRLGMIGQHQKLYAAALEAYKGSEVLLMHWKR